MQTRQNSDLDQHTSHLPRWAQTLARKYFTKTLSQFVLHGNVRDLVRYEKPGSDEITYIGLTHFLAKELFAARDIVVFYDRAAGIHFWITRRRKGFQPCLDRIRQRIWDRVRGKRPRAPSQVLPLLDNYFRLRLRSGKRIACIIDYAETIIPMAEASMYSAEDRSALISLQRWAHDPLFLRHDFTVCLIAENLNDLNQQHVQALDRRNRHPLPDEKIASPLPSGQSRAGNHSLPSILTLAVNIWHSKLPVLDTHSYAPCLRIRWKTKRISASIICQPSRNP